MNYGMNYEWLVKRRPTLYHIADARNWESIQKHGLLSTAALLDLQEVEGARRQAIESAHRPAIVEVAGPSGTVYIRDQSPLQMEALAASLTDLTPQEWLGLLNARVFFWPTRERMESMLKSYQRQEQAVFEVDARRFLERHGSRAEASPINSGYAHPRRGLTRRGSSTFQPLAAFANKASAIAEVTVPHSVPDIFDISRRVVLRHQGREERVLWQALTS